MDTTNTLKSMKKDCDMYFPKGEGIKIISTEEEALINDTIYIMPTDCTYATMIVVDKCGNKRKIGVSLPDNLAFVDLFDSNNAITKEGNVYLKSQIDAKIEELKRDTGIGTDVLDLLRQLSEHLEDYNNPHRVTKEQVGLGNVDNTSDLDKPISKAQEQVNEKLRESISKQEEKACNAIAMVNVETTARTTADQNLATAISELKTIVDAINSWKTTLSQGDTNHMTDTLLEIIKAFSNIPNGVSLAEMFNQKLDKSSVVDNLTSILTNVPLSANQGQVLKTLIDCLRKDVDFALAWCTQLEAIKIRKPQTTLRKPDSDYKYFVVLDEEGNSKRVLAGAGGSIPNNTAFIDHIERDEKGEVVENVVGNTYDKTQVDNKINELNTKISTEATERRNADSSFTIKLNELQGIVDVLQNWKTSFSNSSDDDNIINNIAELLSVFRTMPEGTDILELINTKVSISSIVDSLDSLLTNAPLSAHQGKVLKDLIDAINNSLESIKGDINTLRESLNTKANKSDFDDFKRDSESKFQEHERLINTKAGVDAENLREEDVAKWKQKLGVGGQVELPSNIATIDEGEKHGNVYTKEEIDQILSEDLEAKADRAEVSTKANADASQLTAENITKWKEALGVGELPSNIATIDEGTKQGSVYTKTKVDELLGNSGKNIGNADLQVPAGTVRTLNVEGAKFHISGLANKKTDASFSNKLVVNNRGELAVSDNVEYTMNVPSNLSLNLNVNYTGLTATPPNPTQLEEKVRNLIERLKDVEYIPLLGSNWQENFRDNKISIRESEYINEVSENGWVNLKVVENGNPQQTGALIAKRTADVELPTNKDWLIRFDINSIYRGWRLGIGELDSISFGFDSDNENVIRILNGGAVVAQAGMGIGLIAKTDNVITSMLFAGGRVFVRSEMLNNTTSTLKIKAMITGFRFNFHWLKTKVHYKILN